MMTSKGKGGRMATDRPLFRDRLQSASEHNQSLLCVGLDPDPAMLGGRDTATFCMAIVDATLDLACAYKLNLAFFEAQGSQGYAAVERIVAYINGRVPVVADAKRNDIGNSARFYAKGIFETFGFDAVTVNPFLGRDSLEPRTGMLFLLAPTIWMKGMRIPLDLVWISRQCTIAQIDADVPPPEPGTPDAELPRYSSGATAAHVLEINGGEAQMHGIMVGDSVTFVGSEAEAGGLCE